MEAFQLLEKDLLARNPGLLLNGHETITSQSQDATSKRTMGKKSHRHYTVQHNYHDHSHDARNQYIEERPARGGVTTPFPFKLHEMLEAVAEEGLEHIVSWQPHGRCFLVHDPKAFVDLLPRFFKLSKLASFQRQLNLYGFQRLTRGQDRGGYYHEMFLRDRDYLSHSIQRIKVKGTGVRAKSNPEQEPNFWAMPWVGPQAGAQSVSSSARDSFPSLISESVSTESQQQYIEPRPLRQDRSQDLDVIEAFGNKTFHYLNPIQSSCSSLLQEVPSLNLSDEQIPSISEIDNFFEDFDFSEDIATDLEDDTAFGNVLEQMISSL